MRTDIIWTADDQATSLFGGMATHDTFIEGVLVKRGEHKRVSAAMQDAEGDPVIAVINHGRWLAHCECGGAELVNPVSGAGFYCLSCYNEGNKGKPRPVDVPDKVRFIENQLLKRPHQKNRNCAAGEGLEHIKNENKAHRVK